MYRNVAYDAYGCIAGAFLVRMVAGLTSIMDDVAARIGEQARRMHDKQQSLCYLSLPCPSLSVSSILHPILKCRTILSCVFYFNHTLTSLILVGPL